MPITQDRVIEIVRALRASVQAQDDLVNSLREITTEGLRTGDHAKALSDAAALADFTTQPRAVIEVLAREEAHWRSRAHANVMHKLRMRRLRGDPNTGLGLARSYGDNGAASVAEQREFVKAYLRAQESAPIIAPEGAELTPDSVPIRRPSVPVAKGQEELNATEAKTTKLLHHDAQGRPIEVEVTAEGEPTEGGPLIGNVQPSAGQADTTSQLDPDVADPSAPLIGGVRHGRP